MPNHVTNIVKIKGEPKLIDALIEKLSTVNQEEDFKGNLTGKTFVREFDFNTIIPRPESMNITSGTSTDNAIALIKAENGDMSKVEEIADRLWVIEKALKTKGYKTSSEEAQKELRIKLVMVDLKEKVTDEHRKEGELAIHNLETYGVRDWYSWSIQNWGTKWNAYDIEVRRLSEDTVEYYFDTAWSCPAPVLDELSRQNPDLIIEVQFADEDFGHNCGMFTIKDGYTISQNLPDGGTMEAYKIASEIKGYEQDYFYDNMNWNELEEVTDEDGRLDGWARFCIDEIYGMQFYDNDEPKEWILDELEKMAVASQDFEYAQHIKETKEKVTKK